MKRFILGECKLNAMVGEKQRAEAIERRVETRSERLRGRQMEGENGKTWRLIKGEYGTETGTGWKAKMCRMHQETGKNEDQGFFSSFRDKTIHCTFPCFLPSHFSSPLSLYISLSDGVSLFVPPSSYFLPIPLPLLLLLSCSSHTLFFLSVFSFFGFSVLPFK